MKRAGGSESGAPGRELFYRRALDRLPPEERERERRRGGAYVLKIPYEFSLSALSSFFFETGTRQGWLTGTDASGPLILAVSGGSDSMALLWLFRVFCGFCDGGLIAAHFEHGIRGRESEEDALFVAEMARRWSVEAVIHRGDVPNSLEKGESIETGARRLRYSFFENLARVRGARGVMLGHNRNDMAETTLFNLLRGSGVRGLAGMPERRGIFFRPLLALSHGFLRGVLRHRGIPWREDRTNADDSYTRNYIRNKLLPAIERDVNAGAVEHLADFADEMRYYREEEERQGEALIAAALMSCAPAGGESDLKFDFDFDRAAVSGMSLRERAVLVRETGRRAKIPVLSRERCLELARLMEGRRGFEFQWGEGASVLGDRNSIKWRKNFRT